MSESRIPRRQIFIVFLIVLFAAWSVTLMQDIVFHYCILHANDNVRT